MRRNAFELLMIIACVVTFVAFTLATTKFPHYMAALVVPAAVIVGLALDRLLVEPNPGLRKIAYIVAAMLYLPAVAGQTHTIVMAWALGESPLSPGDTDEVLFPHRLFLPTPEPAVRLPAPGSAKASAPEPRMFSSMVMPPTL